MEIASSALAQLAVDVQNLYAETVRSSDAQLNSQAESQQSLEAISRRIDSIEQIYRDSQDSMTHFQNLCLSLAAKPVQETWQDPGQNLGSNPIQSDSTTLSSTQQETLPHAEEESNRDQRLAFHEGPLAIPVSWQQRRETECSSDCKCSCHTQQNVQALSSLENVLGRLFLSYSGSSVLRKPCSLSECRQQKAKSIRMT